MLDRRDNREVERERERDRETEEGEGWKGSFFPQKQVEEKQVESWIRLKQLQADTEGDTVRAYG